MSLRHQVRLQLAKSTAAPFGAGAFVRGVILLIGEQANNPSGSPEQQPFCCDKGCSGWLNRLMDEEQIPEDELFWVNALNNDGSQVDLTLLMSSLGPRLVIALGGTAAKLCHEHKVSHVKVHHPQYWKRFKNKQRYPLLDLLRENITRTRSVV